VHRPFIELNQMPDQAPDELTIHPTDRLALENFQLAIDAIRGIGAENPGLATRLNAVAKRCQSGHDRLEDELLYSRRINRELWALRAAGLKEQRIPSN
jgi:hypothetical protein